MSSPKRKRALRPRSKSELHPVQSVSVVVPDRLQSLAPNEITPESVGHKGFGVASLPSGWTQPFFVVDSRCDLSAAASHEAGILRACLREATEELRLQPSSLLIVRSSGTTETLSERGLHESATCRPDQLVATLRNLRRSLGSEEASTIHWVVQVKSDAREHGHLSNERRLREESRDWIAEFENREPGIAEARIDHLSVRKWRDGELLSSDRLQCRHSVDLPNVLRQVAQWGMQFASRLHFEWVWDGAYLYVVQADVEEDRQGVDPRSLLPKKHDRVAVGKLRLFRRASPGDFETYAKLRNAALYRRLGYTMPPFYVLSDQSAIHAVINQDLPDVLHRDLESLTGRPLIARVDGTKVPQEKREMLPRSDELRSAEAAARWLTGDFASKVNASDLGNAGLCVIAHHFVPAVSSAWSRAEPNDRWVRVEALWGVPEGLYWYSHDTFEVDTLIADGARASRMRPADFPIENAQDSRGCSWLQTAKEIGSRKIRARRSIGVAV